MNGQQCNFSTLYVSCQDSARGATLHLDSHTGRGHVHPYLRPLRGQTQQVCGLPQVRSFPLEIFKLQNYKVLTTKLQSKNYKITKYKLQNNKVKLSTIFKTATTLLILRCRAAIAFTMVIIVVVNIVVLSLWDQNMDECDLGPN